MIAVGACLGVIAVWANALAISAGVHEDEDGIVSRSLFGAKRYEWSDLAGFDHNRRGNHDYVYARLADGSQHRLTNVLQGQRVVWDEGQTKDIVAILSERLAQRRASRGDPT